MSASTSAASPIVGPRGKRPRFDGSLSRTLDYALAQLEAATDPAVVAAWRQLVDELEGIALRREGAPIE